MTDKVKDQIDEILGRFAAVPATARGRKASNVGALVVNPEPKGNMGPLLFEALVWTELCKAAEKKKDAAWRALQTGDDPIVPADAALRELALGESIVLESKAFSVLVKIGAARKSLDETALITMLVNETGMKAEFFIGLLDRARKEGVRSVSKRVVEV